MKKMAPADFFDFSIFFIIFQSNNPQTTHSTLTLKPPTHTQTPFPKLFFCLFGFYLSHQIQNLATTPKPSRSPDFF